MGPETILKKKEMKVSKIPKSINNYKWNLLRRNDGMSNVFFSSRVKTMHKDPRKNSNKIEKQ